MADTENTASLDELVAKLTSLMGDAGKANEVLEKAKADGVQDTDGAAVLTEEDWKGYGVPKVQARQLVAQLKGAAAKPVAAPAAAPALGTLLPSVPSDDDFLKLLQVGGVAKMDKTDVQAAVRALFADRYGVYDLDDRILEAVAARAEELDEPYPPLYYDIEKSKTAKKHADVLKALGVPGRVVNEARKKQFLGRMNGLWGILGSFQDQLDNWYTTWTQKAANPAALIGAFTAMASGGGAVMPGLMDAPDATHIVDSAAGVIDQLNKLFAGPGIPVARALAADAVEFRQLLEKPELPASLGTSTREEMLKKLGIAVTADVVRAERSAVQYVLGVMELGAVAQNQLPLYIGALKELGSTIPWDKLSGRVADGRPAPYKGAARRETF
jgi:hypothetical protein